jgi:hypothetical protein
MLVWNSLLAEVHKGVLFALWQDNNAVLLTTTAFSPEERVLSLRKCPRLTAKNRRILEPVFQGSTEKWLFIPRAIDAYNHHMNGVDLANQLRKSMSTHRPQIYRTWVPNWHYIFDTLLNNTFLAWKQDSNDHDIHRKFAEALIAQMTTFKEAPPLRGDPAQPLQHEIIRLKARNYCIYPGCSGRKNRRFGDPIINAVKRSRSARVDTYCAACKAYLCTRRPCWTKHHASLRICK